MPQAPPAAQTLRLPPQRQQRAAAVALHPAVVQRRCPAAAARRLAAGYVAPLHHWHVLVMLWHLLLDSAP